MDVDRARIESAVQRAAAANEFSGAVRVDVGGEIVVEFAGGCAHRAERIENRLDTRFGVASVTKGFTALAVMSLVADGLLALDTPVRTIVGESLPNVDPAVTIDHLLTHRSGVGDYLDEDAVDDIDDYVLGDRSVHTLERPVDYVTLLADLPQAFPPGERFAYNNGGYAILAIVIEHVTGSFHRAVDRRVFEPAGMSESGFFRADRMPERTATGYLQDGRTNVFHLPIIGGGDGGAYTSVGDCIGFWRALHRGRIVGDDTAAAMTTPITIDTGGGDAAFGRGCWLSADADHVWLEGMDAGVSARTGHIRSADVTYAVLSNTSSGAWPLVRALLER